MGLDGEATGERVARFVDHLRQRASSFGGSVVLLEAPEHLKDGVDVWGPVGALGLMRSVKHQFDPERRGVLQLVALGFSASPARWRRCPRASGRNQPGGPEHGRPPRPGGNARS